MISNDELFILSYYRAGELHGAMLMGRMALHTTIDAIRAPLTRHCLEEAEHAWIWTQTIKDLGCTPLRVTRTYQAEYGRVFGMPKNTLELFGLTQILERRVLSHFKRHLERSGTHPRVQQSLEKMISDEEGHLSWIWDEFQRHGTEHGEDTVADTMNRLEEVDRQVYESLRHRSPFKEYFG